MERGFAAHTRGTVLYLGKPEVQNEILQRFKQCNTIAVIKVVFGNFKAEKKIKKKLVWGNIFVPSFNAAGTIASNVTESSIIPLDCCNKELMHTSSLSYCTLPTNSIYWGEGSPEMVKVQGER